MTIIGIEIWFRNNKYIEYVLYVCVFSFSTHANATNYC